MHVPKFKIGDVIFNKDYNKRRIVVQIVHKLEMVKGNWPSGHYEIQLENTYVLEREEDKRNVYAHFGEEDLYDLVSRQEEIQSTFNKCPRCGGELKDHMSFGLGEMIKKCSNQNCGWC